MKYLYLIVLLITLGCTFRQNNSLSDNYYQDHQKWRTKRLDRLKSPEGWLNLAGLYWLSEGINTIGSDSSNTHIFPDKAPLYCGKINKTGNSLYFFPNPDAGIKVNGSSTDSILLIPDTEKNKTLIETGSLSWFIIKRDSLYGIRLRDYDHPRIDELDSIPFYPLTIEWVKEARYVPREIPDTIFVPTAIGTEEQYLVPGTLHFTHQRKEYKLYPFSSGDGLFLIIGDRTSGITTYAAGRFLYINKPDRNNRIILDFNMAYNPPCAFSPYATCPLPPPENRLKLKVEAGELAVHLH